MLERYFRKVDVYGKSEPLQEETVLLACFLGLLKHSKIILLCAWFFCCNMAGEYIICIFQMFWPPKVWGWQVPWPFNLIFLMNEGQWSRIEVEVLQIISKVPANSNMLLLMLLIFGISSRKLEIPKEHFTQRWARWRTEMVWTSLYINAMSINEAITALPVPDGGGQSRDGKEYHLSLLITW